jgi:predicted Fe-Mo cluster-binding NifX family protein
MIYCIPTDDEYGLESSISPHFGRAAFFTFVDGETGVAESLRNDESRRVHGACVPTEEILRRGVDRVICRGIGRGASAKLAAAGVEVHLTHENVTSFALDALRNGATIPLGGRGACSDDHGDC